MCAICLVSRKFTIMLVKTDINSNKEIIAMFVHLEGTRGSFHFPPFKDWIASTYMCTSLYPGQIGKPHILKGTCHD